MSVCDAHFAIALTKEPFFHRHPFPEEIQTWGIQTKYRLENVMAGEQMSNPKR